MAIDGTGAVRAMIGGYDYADSQFDRATEAGASPARPSSRSSIWRRSKRAARRTACATTRRSGSASGRRKTTTASIAGQVTLREALAQSLNSVAAQLAMEVGPKAVVETAHRLGIASELEPQCLDRARHLGGDAAGTDGGLCAVRQWRLPGRRPFLITRVTTPDGKVLYERTPRRRPRVVRPRELWR